MNAKPPAITVGTACRDTFANHDADRSMFQAEFCRRLLAEPGIHGRVIDIGCGPRLPEVLGALEPALNNLDGVDPMPGTASRHPLLKNYWEAPFEDADIPTGSYDLAYAYNVAEHISDPAPFFEKVRSILKPGGVFWALTPHRHHPFARIVRVVERLGLKGHAAERNEGINQYPAYYRLNSAKAVEIAVSQYGFASAELVYIPCLQWDQYFPRSLRWMPHIYDRVAGLHFRRFMLLLAYRLSMPS